MSTVAQHLMTAEEFWQSPSGGRRSSMYKVLRVAAFCVTLAVVTLFLAIALFGRGRDIEYINNATVTSFSVYQDIAQKDDNKYVLLSANLELELEGAPEVVMYPEVVEYTIRLNRADGEQVLDSPIENMTTHLVDDFVNRRSFIMLKFQLKPTQATAKLTEDVTLEGTLIIRDEATGRIFGVKLPERKFDTVGIRSTRIYVFP